MLSVPPARTTRASPRRMARAAHRTACRPEPQAWLTVKAGRSSGAPARWAIWRAVLGPPPAWRAWPKITWSTRSMRPGDRPARDSAAAAAGGARAGDRNTPRAAPNLPGGGPGVVPFVLVDPPRARLHLPRDLVGLADVAGPDAGGEAVDVGVGLRHGVLDVAERDHHQHRPEDLFSRHGHVVVDAVEDGRLHEPALAADARRLAAVGDPRALAPADVDVTQHALALLGRHQRAEARLGVERIARDQAAGALHQALDQLVVDLLLDEQARAGGAYLTLAVKDAVVGALHRSVEIGVGEDDVRRLAAQLEGDALDGVGGAAHDVAPDLGRAGERDLGHLRVLHQGVADRRAAARDDVQDARRQAGLGPPLGGLECRQRRVGGRLVHHRVAAGQRRRDLPQRLDEREVPRGDRGDQPDRLAQGVGEHERTGHRQRVAGDLVGPAGEVAQRVARGRQVDVARIEDRLTLFERLGQGELVDARLEGVGDLVEQPAAVTGRRLLAPVAGERGVRRLAGTAGHGAR